MSEQSVHVPRILPPVAIGDGVVWVSGTTPGATITVRQGDTTRGALVATAPVTAVPVTGVTAGPVHATAHLAAQDGISVEVTAIRDPGEAGEFPNTSFRDVAYGNFQVPVHDTPEGAEGGFSVPLSGRVWLPAGADGQVPDQLGRRPLVVIAQGYWLFPEEDVESLKGYAWLAEHLARWGMVACSIDLSTVNRHTEEQTQQWSRGEVIVEMLDRLTTDPALSGLLDTGRVGLVGHSMGGEGVVTAQAVNRIRDRRHGIRGLVSLAPTNYRPDIGPTHAAYLQLHGSMDYLLQLPSEVTGQSPRFGGPRLYDRAWRPRTLAWIEGARHEGWNPVWLASPASLEPPPAPGLPALSADRQQAIGRALVTAFFSDVLFGRVAYRGYLSGPATPRAVGNIPVRRQHQPPSVVVVDDFGDPDEQLDLSPEDPPDKTVNRLGEQARTDGEGVDRWLDVDHRTLPRSVHDTHGLDFAWREDTTSYESRIGTIEVLPSDVLSLKVAQHYDEPADGDPIETWNPVGEDLDLVVVLDDGARQAAVKLSVFEPVPYPSPGLETYSVFGTTRLPVDAFTAVEPALDITALKRIRLVASERRTGRLLVDDIEFETPAVTLPSLIAMLRVHDLGGGYGPSDDHLDTEVIVHLAGRPGESFGLALRQDAELPANQGMFAALRDSLVRARPVRLAYQWAGPTVRKIVRVVPEWR